MGNCIEIKYKKSSCSEVSYIMNIYEITDTRKNLLQMTHDVYDMYKNKKLTQKEFATISNSILNAMDECDKVIHKK